MKYGKVNYIDAGKPATAQGEISETVVCGMVWLQVSTNRGRTVKINPEVVTSIAPLPQAVYAETLRQPGPNDAREMPIKDLEYIHVDPNDTVSH